MFKKNKPSSAESSSAAVQETLAQNLTDVFDGPLGLGTSEALQHATKILSAEDTSNEELLDGLQRAREITSKFLTKINDTVYSSPDLSRYGGIAEAAIPKAYRQFIDKHKQIVMALDVRIGECEKYIRLENGDVAETFLQAAYGLPQPPSSRIRKAVEIALDHGNFDGSHHKMWTIDQMLRALLADEYDTTIAEYNKGEDGNPANWVPWDIGSPP